MSNSIWYRVDFELLEEILIKISQTMDRSILLNLYHPQTRNDLQFDVIKWQIGKSP